MTRETRPSGTGRLNLAVAPSTRALMEDLQRRTEAASLEEVVRRAVSAYGLLVAAHEAGGRVQVQTPSGAYRMVVLP